MIFNFATEPEILSIFFNIKETPEYNNNTLAFTSILILF